MVEIHSQLHVPDHELSFQTSRSSGPGGQNVNKVESRVTLCFDLAGSPSLSPEQKQLLAERLHTRISREGILQVVSQQHRTQAANRAAVVERFAELLRRALKVAPPRRRRAVPAAAKLRRQQDKRQRARVKHQRGQVRRWDE